MKNEIANKHDATFKEVFSQKKIAKDFIQNNLPQEVLDIMDIESLELQKDTFINQDLVENFSDLIYKVQIKDRVAYISFLLEHKSYKDKMTIFQIHKYILETWMAQVQKENNEYLPIILPMVIYHGKEKWNLKTDVRDMIPGFKNLPIYIQERLPVFKHDFFNIGEYNESDFEKLTKLTAMMLKAFKYAFEDDIEVVLRVYLMALEDLKDEEPLETLIYYGEIYLRYIGLTNSKVNEKDIVEQIKKLDGKGAVTMSFIEKIEERGMEKGIEKGIEKGELKAKKEIAKTLLDAGMEIALVVKTTGLSKVEVEELRNPVS